MKKNKQPPRTRAKPQNAPRRQAPPRRQTQGALAAGYSSSRRQSFTFNGSDSLRCKFSIAIYEIGAGAGTRDGLRGSAGVANQTANVRLSPTDPGGYTVAGAATQNAFLSPAPDLLFSAFARFRVESCVFRYCPQSGTNTTQRMVFAFAADPAHPLIDASAAVTQAKLEAVADSVPFAPWEEWELSVTHALDKKAWLYTYDTLSGSGTNDLIERFAAFGCIGCQSSANGTAVTGDVFGVLYMDLSVEFREFAPISTSTPTMVASLVDKFHTYQPESYCGLRSELRKRGFSISKLLEKDASTRDPHAVGSGWCDIGEESEQASDSQGRTDLRQQELSRNRSDLLRARGALEPSPYDVRYPDSHTSPSGNRGSL